jgi:hypothetical protein
MSTVTAEMPEKRLLTLSLAFEETYVFGRLERAVEEVDKVRATEVRFTTVLEAKVVQIPVLKFGVLRILLCRTFMLQARALSVVEYAS